MVCLLFITKIDGDIEHLKDLVVLNIVLTGLIQICVHVIIPRGTKTTYKSSLYPHVYWDTLYRVERERTREREISKMLDICEE